MGNQKINFQLNLCTSKDKFRDNLSMIHVTKKHVFATDSHMLVHIPTSFMFDNDTINDDNWFDFYIDSNQYKLLLNSTAKASVNFDAKIITSIKSTGVFNISILPADSLKFPNCKVLINLSDDNLTEKNTMHINLDLLTKANKALNIQKDKGVTIKVKDNNHYYVFSKEHKNLSYDIPFALVMGMVSY